MQSQILNTGIIVHCNNTHDIGEVALELANELQYMRTTPATVTDNYGLYIECNPTVTDLCTISAICQRHQVQLKVVLHDKLLLVRHTTGVPVMTLLGTLHKTDRIGAMALTIIINREVYQL